MPHSSFMGSFFHGFNFVVFCGNLCFSSCGQGEQEKASNKYMDVMILPDSYVEALIDLTNSFLIFLNCVTISQFVASSGVTVISCILMQIYLNSIFNYLFLKMFCCFQSGRTTAKPSYIQSKVRSQFSWRCLPGKAWLKILNQVTAIRLLVLPSSREIKCQSCDKLHAHLLLDGNLTVCCVVNWSLC